MQVERSMTIIGGASGVGKSSLVKELKKDPEVKAISMGDLYYKVMKDAFPDLKRDQISKLDWKSFTNEVSAEFSRELRNTTVGNMLMDEHYATEHNGIFILPSLSGMQSIGSALKESGYVHCNCVLLFAPAPVVYERVKYDSVRKRGKSLEKITLELESNAELFGGYAAQIANFVSVRKFIVENRSIQETVLMIKKIMEI